MIIIILVLLAYVTIDVFWIDINTIITPGSSDDLI